jgi:hypothetical protein
MYPVGRSVPRTGQLADLAFLDRVERRFGLPRGQRHGAAGA